MPTFRRSVILFVRSTQLLYGEGTKSTQRREIRAKLFQHGSFEAGGNNRGYFMGHGGCGGARPAARRLCRCAPNVYF